MFTLALKTIVVKSAESATRPRSLSLVSPKAVKERSDSFGQRPIGTGAFAVADYASKDHVTLVRNPRLQSHPAVG